MKKYILILTIFVFASCDNFLDVKPTGSLIPTTVEDFDKLLNNYRQSWYGWTNLTYMDPDMYMPGKNYNDLWKREWQRQYTWDENPYEPDADDRDWNYRYQYIHIYNQVVNNIDEAPLGKRTENDRKLIKGEAMAQRAMDYFLLVNEYGPHYSSSTLDAPAVPMPLVVDLQAQLPRATVKDVYDQILADLLAADDLLKEAAVYRTEANFRPGRAAVKALLATVYLYMGDFAKAETYSDEALAMYDFVYDFNTIDHYDPGNAWSGLSINDFDYSTDAKSVIWNRYQRWVFYDPAGLYHPDLEALYNKATDRRWYLFSSSETYYGVDVSPNFCYARYYAENNVGMTTPKLMLVNAEAKVRNGKGQEAIDRLNELAAYRYTTGNATFTYTDDATTLQIVKDERRRELAMTGVNLIDQKRYHAYGEPVPTYTRTIPDGQTFTLEPGSDKYVVPIARKVKSFNPNL